MNLFPRGPGRAIGLLCLLTILICSAAFAEARSVRLIYADNENWRAHLLVTCDDPDGCEVMLSSCPIGPVPTFTLAAGESRIAPNFRRLQCTADTIGLASLTILRGNPRLSTSALFRDVRGAGIASVEIAPIVMTSPGGTLEARLVQNDDDYTTMFALFSDGNATAFGTALVFDETNQLVGTEEFDISPGFNFLPLKTSIHAGRLEIFEGTVGYGCPGCDYAPPIGGVAFVNWRAGGSPRAVPLVARASP